jgi:hypothetical protein
MAINRPNNRPLQSSFPAPGLNSTGDRASLLCIGRFLHRGHPGASQSGTFEAGASDDEKCTLTSPAKDGNRVHGRGRCRLRRMSTRRSTRQDAQINYLSTLSIFMKQTTYLATLPNPNLKANECPCFCHPKKWSVVSTYRDHARHCPAPSAHLPLPSPKPKNIFAIREWKCAQSGSKTHDHPIYGPLHRRAQRQYPRLPARKAPPRLRRPVARATRRLPRAPGDDWVG